MSTESKNLNAALEDFAKGFAENPEIAEVIAKAQSGEVDEMTAMSQLMNIVIGNPKLQEALVTQAMTSLSGQDNPIADPSVMFQPPSGLERVDPILEAHAAERLQFDGDAPELRQHILPEGRRPAVPVKGATANPVALGWTLQQASDDVLDEIKSLTSKVTADTTDLIVRTDDTALMTQPEGFKPGKVPALREAAMPTGMQLMQLPKEEQQQLAWGSFTTTQGRRSSAPTLASMVEDRLRRKGISNVSVGAHGGQMRSSDEGIVAKGSWVINIGGSGPLSTNEGFSLMETAAAALAAQFIEQGIDTPNLSLEVCTVDTYQRRQVGWAALLRA